MIPLSLIQGLPWRWIGIAAAVLSVFIGGCQYGEQKVQAAWHESTAKIEKAVSEQAVKVAEHEKASTNINNGISNYVQARRAGIAGTNFSGLRQPSGNSTVSGISGSAAGIATSAEGCISTADYNQLAADAADDAVIILGWQKWYEEQEAAWPE